MGETRLPLNAEVAKAPEDSMRLAVLGMVSSQGLVGWQVGSKWWLSMTPKLVWMMHPCFLFLEGGELTFGWELTYIYVHLKRIIFRSTQNGSLPGEVSNFDNFSVRGIQLDANEKRWATFQRGKKPVPGHKTAWSLGCDSSRFSGSLPREFFLTAKMGLVVDMGWRLVIYRFG